MNSASNWSPSARRHDEIYYFAFRRCAFDLVPSFFVRPLTAIFFLDVAFPTTAPASSASNGSGIFFKPRTDTTINDIAFGTLNLVKVTLSNQKTRITTSIRFLIASIIFSWTCDPFRANNQAWPSVA